MLVNDVMLESPLYGLATKSTTATLQYMGCFSPIRLTYQPLTDFKLGGSNIA